MEERRRERELERKAQRWGRWSSLTGLGPSAARVKAGGGLSYADAFCIATAERLDAPLWTGDPEIVDLADELPCAITDLRASDG